MLELCISFYIILYYSDTFSLVTLHQKSTLNQLYAYVKIRPTD